MQLSTLFIAMASAALMVSALPAPVPEIDARADGPGHPYDCPNGKSTKEALERAGATVHDLAITILETGCAMSGTSYPFGDVLPNGQPKTGDSANFGLFKNNWGQIRTHCSQFKGQAQGQWKNGQVLNHDAHAAIRCQHEMINALGWTKFYVNQRGAGGAAGGADYGHAVEFIMNYLRRGHLHDNSVTFYNLHAV